MREGVMGRRRLVPPNQGQTPPPRKKYGSLGKGTRERWELGNCNLTRSWGFRALQAVASGGGEAALGDAALAAGQHSSWSHDAWWGLLPKPAVQVLDFLFL